MKNIKCILSLLVVLIIGACSKNVNNEEPSKKQLSTNIQAKELSEDLKQWVDLIDKEMRTNPKQAIILCNKLIETAHATKNREGEALGYYERGYTYNYYLEEHGNAFKDYYQALTFYTELNIPQAVNECLLEIGSALYSLKLYEKALGYYQQLLENAQKTNNKSDEAKAYRNTALCYRELNKDINLVILYFKKSLVIQQELSNEVGIAECYNSIASTYYFVNNEYQKAKEYYLQAAIIFQSENKMEELGNVYYNLGLLHNEMKEIEVARNYFKQSIELGKQYNYPDLVVSGEFQLGKMQANLKNYSQAINHGLAALSVIQHNQLLKSEISYFLSQSYEAIGNKDQALAYSNQTIQLNKKNEENKLTYLSKENEQRATVHDFEIKIDKNATNDSTSWMIGGIVLISLLTYVLTRIYYRKQNIGLLQAIKVSQARNQEFKSTLADARKQLLYFSREIVDLKNRLGI